MPLSSATLSSEAVEAARISRAARSDDDDDVSPTSPLALGRSPVKTGAADLDEGSGGDSDDPVTSMGARAMHTPRLPTREPSHLELPARISRRSRADEEEAVDGAGEPAISRHASHNIPGSPLARMPSVLSQPAEVPGGGGSGGGGSAPQPSSPKPWHHTAHAMHDGSADAEMAQVCSMLQEAIAMRQRYMKSHSRARHAAEVEPSPVPLYDPFAFPAEGPPPRSSHVFEFRQGVMAVWAGSEPPSLLQAYEAKFRMHVDFRQFTLDLGRLHDICSAGPVYSFCVRRLALLESRYKLHTMEKEGAELAQMRSNPHRDYYNCRKVDTHIHLAAAMNQKHLLRFIKRKMKIEPDTPVIAKNGRTLSLREVCAELRLSPYDINLDSLGMHADSSTFRRFDKFNLKYNPLGDASLREIFIKTDNYVNGRYLAELTKELFADLEESKYVNTEYRLSIYGRKPDEWPGLADWVVLNKLWSPNNRWLIQVPRLFHLYAANGSVADFEQFLSNLFAPLFEATRDPAAHPHLHLFLQQVVGFDCVDDESKPDSAIPQSEADWARGGYPHEPKEWTSAQNPHYAYYIYYMHANINVLNQFRRSRGFSTFDFRPHAGEAGELSHLHSTFLCAHAINHGLLLRRSPALQYLYYLTQIGIAMSPLSNNMLFCELARSPFPTYFVRGLNVCVSTDDPLMFHYTKEPLMEEYCIARHTWQLSPVDLSELFRASVLHSSFEREVKAYWLGANFWRPGAAGNDITRTNVPDIRLRFRDQAHREELHVVYESAAASCAATISAAASEHPRPPNQGQLLRTAGGPISLDTLSRAHEAQHPLPNERLMPNAQGRRQSAATDAMRAAVAALGAGDERTTGEGEDERTVLGLPLATAVALGVGAATMAASAFALGAAAAGLFSFRRGRRNG